MKTKSISLVFIALAAFSASFKTGDSACNSYFPVKQGAQLEIKNYDNKDKVTGRTVQVVTGVSTSGTATVINVKGTSYDGKDKQLGDYTFDAKCDNGSFSINMASAANMNNVRANMQVTMKGDNLDFPSTLTAGQVLNGGTLTITMVPQNAPPGMMNITLTETISNRKVLGDTTITTPAGTFNCKKMAMDENVKSPLYSETFHVISCFAQNVGRVRSETYDSKGKLKGYSQLSSISGN